jgi:hypothetical protein
VSGLAWSSGATDAEAARGERARRGARGGRTAGPSGSAVLDTFVVLESTVGTSVRASAAVTVSLSVAAAA